jgi:prolyl-tRNA synthetase
MKDAYTFDRDREGLDRQYELQASAYDRIFERAGLEFYKVESDVGMMGGVGAHEYMAPSAAGENDIARTDSGYAANIEVASAVPQPVETQARAAPETVDTPGAKTIEQVAGMLQVPAGALIKALPVVVEGRGQVMVLVRGDHRLNEIKLQNHLKAPFRQATEEEIGPHVGFIGPVGTSTPILADEALRGMKGLVAGANEPDKHLVGVEPGRDFEPEWGDIRSVEAGDTDPDGNVIWIEPAIEVGNIFKLGTRYTEPLNATYLDEDGTEKHIWMGSYGIGPARILAAAVEQYADEAGISWPKAIAPFQVHLVTLGKPGEPAREAADKLYEELEQAGLDTLYDDRESSAGEKFADAELLGCPIRLTLGKRGVEAGEVEVQIRRGREKRSIPLEGAAEATAELWRAAP